MYYNLRVFGFFGTLGVSVYVDKLSLTTNTESGNQKCE
jgi:hypothetical protein